ncbi:MAG: CHAT domain-containing protein [Nitrospirales bacterium]
MKRSKVGFKTKKTSTRKTTRVTRSSKTATNPGKPHAMTPGKSKRALSETIIETGYKIQDEEIERILITGSHEGLLEEYLGQSDYEELRELARQSSRRSVRGGTRVLLLPGIMGSKIGKKRKFLFDDVIWIDPIDIARGNLVDLALRRKNKYHALGVILFAYLKLKLRLKIAGFDADFHPFDWRQSLHQLGSELAMRIERESAKNVRLVAHSMGGLVARVALTHAAHKKVEQLIMLGTPNFGSFVPVQAIRGTYPIVQKVARLDLKHSPKELSEKIFKTFPGLHEMLPSPKRFKQVNLYDASLWPNDAPVPSQALLDNAIAVQNSFAKADKRFFLIAGVNQETTTGLQLKDGTFQYELSQEGDGTVPIQFAELPNTTTYYVEESHGSLPNNRTVGSAVIDILRSGNTKHLAQSWIPQRGRSSKILTKSDLQTKPMPKRHAHSLTAQERRELLSELVSPGADDSITNFSSKASQHKDNLGNSHGMIHSLKNVAITRRREHSIEICLAHGDITEVQARATVLGLFSEVEPSGAAGAIDERLNGAVKEFTTRRMFSGTVGEVFAMPTGRHLIYAETVLFMGLGSFDSYNDEVQQFVAENAVRTFVQTHVEDFASVLLGGASGWSIQNIVYNQLRGYIRGILDADSNHTMRRITLCEYNAERYMEMKKEVYRLAGTELFADIMVTFDEVKLPDSTFSPVRRRQAHVQSDTSLAYLIVNQEEKSNGQLTYRSSILTSGSKATVLTGTKEVSQTQLDNQLNKIEKSGFTFKTIEKFGKDLTGLVLHDSVAAGLADMQDHHLVVVNDAPSSRIPWETMCINGWFPAAAKGLSRRYIAGNLSVAKWLEKRRIGDTLDVLLVVNPTLDLPGAEREAARLKDLITPDSSVRLHEIQGERATRPLLLEEFSSGNYDVIHYAGHAYFDAEDRSRSGIVCHGRQILNGAHLAGIAKLPALLFFNACESARVRRGALKENSTLLMKERNNRNVGLAEAFMRGGAANYVGTYWPVGDDAAAAFAETFYKDLVLGESIGKALQNGRKAVRKLNSVDWADYIHYGSYDFVLKHRDSV